MKDKIGYVFSTKMNKNLIVLVPYHKFHKKYKKLILCKNLYKVFDYRKEAKDGDLVLIRKNSSKYNKNFSLIKIFYNYD